MNHPSVAIIGLIASLITIFVFLTGKASLFDEQPSVDSDKNIVSRSGTLFIDFESSLVWQKYDSGVLRSLEGALNSCKNLEANGKKFRLPTAGELKSIGKVRSFFQLALVDNTGVAITVGLLAAVAGAMLASGQPGAAITLVVIAMIFWGGLTERKPNIDSDKIVAKSNIYWANSDGLAVDFGDRGLSVVSKDPTSLQGVLCVSEL